MPSARVRLNFFSYDDSPFHQNFALLVDVDTWSIYRYSGPWIPPASVWDEQGRFYDRQIEFPLAFEVIKETTYKSKPVTAWRSNVIFRLRYWLNFKNEIRWIRRNDQSKIP